MNRGGWEVGLGRSRMHPTVLLCALTSLCVCVCVYGEVRVEGGEGGGSICEIMCSYSPVECKKREGGGGGGRGGSPRLSFSLLGCFLFSFCCAAA